MPTDAPSVRRPRIVALDVLRGVALCGILLANVRPIAGRATDPVAEQAVGEAAWVGLLVHQRFFPLFSLLFGIGFALLLESVAGRTDRPRLLLLRRLLALLAIGLVHLLLLWRGDILTVYAVVALLVLLPSTWLPTPAVTAGGVALTATALGLGGDRTVLVAGLFLLGSALVRSGALDRLTSSVRLPVLLAVAFAAGALPALWLQTRSDATVWFALAGLLLAGLYACAVLVLLRTPLALALRVVFAPLGRTALTNYLTATLLVLAITGVLGPAVVLTSEVATGIAAAVLAVQWVASTLWLRWFRQGPLEWLWRWATYGRRPPFRRDVRSRLPRMVR